MFSRICFFIASAIDHIPKITHNTEFVHISRAKTDQNGRAKASHRERAQGLYRQRHKPHQVDPEKVESCSSGVHRFDRRSRDCSNNHPAFTSEASKSPSQEVVVALYRVIRHLGRWNRRPDVSVSFPLLPPPPPLGTLPTKALKPYDGRPITSISD